MEISNGAQGHHSPASVSCLRPCAHIDYGSIIRSVIQLRSLKLARTNFSPRSGPVQGRTEIFVDNCARVLNRAIMHWTFTWAACPANGACSWLAGSVTHTEGGKKGDRWQLVWSYRGTDVQALKHEVW